MKYFNAKATGSTIQFDGILKEPDMKKLLKTIQMHHECTIVEIEERKGRTFILKQYPEKVYGKDVYYIKDEKGKRLNYQTLKPYSGKKVDKIVMVSRSAAKAYVDVLNERERRAYAN